MLIRNIWISLNRVHNFKSLYQTSIQFSLNYHSFSANHEIYYSNFISKILTTFMIILIVSICWLAFPKWGVGWLLLSFTINALIIMIKNGKLLHHFILFYLILFGINFLISKNTRLYWNLLTSSNLFWNNVFKFSHKIPDRKLLF